MVQRIHLGVLEAVLGGIAVPPLPHRGRALSEHVPPGRVLGALYQSVRELRFADVAQCGQNKPAADKSGSQRVAPLVHGIRQPFCRFIAAYKPCGVGEGIRCLRVARYPSVLIVVCAESTFYFFVHVGVVCLFIALADYAAHACGEARRVGEENLIYDVRVGFAAL